MNTPGEVVPVKDRSARARIERRTPVTAAVELIPLLPVSAPHGMLLPRCRVTLDYLEWVHFSEFNCWVTIPAGSASPLRPVMVAPFLPNIMPSRDRPTRASGRLLQMVRLHFGDELILQDAAARASHLMENFQSAQQRPGAGKAREIDTALPHVG